MIPILPLPIWFVAVLLLCEVTEGMSAMEHKRTLWGNDKGSYKTPCYLCRRIRAAMKEVEQPMLDSTVEMDETYVGGKEHCGSRGWSMSHAAGDNSGCVVGIPSLTGLWKSCPSTGSNREHFR